MLTVKSMTTQGIASISDLYVGDTLQSADQLMTQYHLQNNARFNCLRITHFLQPLPPPSISLPSTVWKFYSTAKTDTKGISFFYNMFQDKLVFSKTAAMTKWEVDLDTTFSTEQWTHAFKAIHKASHCVKHWELTIKIANRWHYTPLRIATFFPGASPSCWRACGHTGNLLHMLWHCPTIKGLWNQVFRLISTLTGVISSPDPALALLHIDIDRYPCNMRPVVTHILLETRTMILRHWKSNKAINVSDIVAGTHRNYTFERLIAINNMKCKQFDACWSIWPKCL